MWAERVIPSFAWIIPASVAISIFGALNGSVFTLGRLSYAASQSGQLPIIVSMLNIHRSTPAPAMILSTVIATAFLISSNLIALMNYFGFSIWLMTGLTCTSVIVLRYREPDLLRPYKVHRKEWKCVTKFLTCILLYVMFGSGNFWRVSRSSEASPVPFLPVE